MLLVQAVYLLRASNHAILDLPSSKAINLRDMIVSAFH
jgi:hypothetical protein